MHLMFPSPTNFASRKSTCCLNAFDDFDPFELKLRNDNICEHFDTRNAKLVPWLTCVCNMP